MGSVTETRLLRETRPQHEPAASLCTSIGAVPMPQKALPQWLVRFELRYPIGSESFGGYAIISRHLAETGQQRRFAFELRLGEYAATATASGAITCMAVCASGYRDVQHESEILGAFLAFLGVFHEVERYSLSRFESRHAGARDRTDVHENVRGAVVRLDKAESLSVVKERYGSFFHDSLFVQTVIELCRHRTAIVSERTSNAQGAVSVHRFAARGRCYFLFAFAFIGPFLACASIAKCSSFFPPTGV